MNTNQHRDVTQLLFPDHDQEVKLVSTDDQAVLLYGRDALICFNALVRLSPEELFEYVNRGIFRELVSARFLSRVLHSGRLFNGILQPEPADHLLYRPHWYTVYFISRINLPGPPGDPGLPQAVKNITDFFVPGHALIDYHSQHVYAHSLSVSCQP